VGWIGGWLGGFIWVLIMSVLWLVRGRELEGITGLVLVGVAAVLIIAFAPWRHPTTPYWRLMLPAYIMFFVSIAWAVWSFRASPAEGFSWWSIWLILALLMPFGTSGRRRWDGLDAKRSAATARDERDC
jgi:uncharacterized membrane protein YfcA